MITKLKDALKQKYNASLGLGDEVYEGVASAIGNLITDESQIDIVVANAEAMLKKYQSIGDSERTKAANERKRADELQKKVEELEGRKPDPTPTPTEPPQNLAEQIAAAVASAISPLNEELAALKNERASLTALDSAKTTFFKNDYTKVYSDEANAAWDCAIDFFEDGGKKMSSEALSNKALAIFSKIVSRKGVDTTQPFVGSPDEVEGVTDWASERKRKQSQGKIAAD